VAFSLGTDANEEIQGEMYYLYYCLAFESLPLIRTQCVRNMLMHMKMKTLSTPRIT